jgi:hypothetical protein
MSIRERKSRKKDQDVILVPDHRGGDSPKSKPVQCGVLPIVAPVRMSLPIISADPRKKYLPTPPERNL